MKINALLMDPNDNVVTCVEEVKKGNMVTYQYEGKYKSMEAMEDIPYCHKIALEDIEKGGKVIKYGELIGESSEDIGKGCWVSDKNIFSIPRDYVSEMMEV